MSFIQRLSDASNSAQSLALFIQENSVELYDFFISQKNASAISHRADIEKYILPKYGIYRDLNFEDSGNEMFLFCLLDISQRFGLASEFQQVYHLALKSEISLNSRLIAASRYLVDVKSIDDYDTRMADILSDLAISFLEEEDSEQKPISSLIYFYIEIFYNFSHNINRVLEIRAKLIEQLANEYSFLLTQPVEEILSYSLDDTEELYQAVQTKLDEILERASEYLVFNFQPNLIESDTEYSNLLAGVSSSFTEIRNLSANLYSMVASDEVFWSLQRGVKVLTEENQLLAYLFSFGKMHYEKMISALSSIKQQHLKSELEIYDWGCGQGLASVCFFEYVKSNNVECEIKQFTLIEPSEIAIKRASLHLRKFTTDIKVITLNKDLDSLQPSDFDSNKEATKVHLFSNILDIDLFSMHDLISLVNDSFEGRNIFVCVSPFVSEVKTGRIDSFVQSFFDRPKFEVISNMSERNGEWAGKKWSRVVRVFKCTIE